MKISLTGKRILLISGRKWDCLPRNPLPFPCRSMRISHTGQRSMGQQQRLCLARGLAVEPEIILCDEPTSALDPVSSQHIEQQLLQLKEDYTIVIVTHNIHQAMRLADYVIHLYLGEIVEHGPAKEVFENPKEERTRAYINGTFLTETKIDKEINL